MDRFLLSRKSGDIAIVISRSVRGLHTDSPKLPPKPSHHRLLISGLTPVSNVESNREFQQLDKYCIDEYNSIIKRSVPTHSLLHFSMLVAAEKKVMSGFKFYLKILAGEGGDEMQLFDAVVLVVMLWVKIMSKDSVSLLVYLNSLWDELLQIICEEIIVAWELDCCIAVKAQLPKQYQT